MRSPLPFASCFRYLFLLSPRLSCTHLLRPPLFSSLSLCLLRLFPFCPTKDVDAASPIVQSRDRSKKKQKRGTKTTVKVGLRRKTPIDYSKLLRCP